MPPSWPPYAQALGGLFEAMSFPLPSVGKCRLHGSSCSVSPAATVPDTATATNAARKAASHEQARLFLGAAPTGEVSAEDLQAPTRLAVTTEASAISEADVIIVAVPTPVDEAHVPDFSPLVGSSTTAGKHMKKNAMFGGSDER